jgi:hypothetical protein
MALSTKQKKAKVKGCWEDLLLIVTSLIAEVKAGKVTLSAGLLREINVTLGLLSQKIEEDEAEAKEETALSDLAAALPDELRNIQAKSMRTQ